MSSGFNNDPHSERGYACPKNCFGITDYLELQQYEGPLVGIRGGELIDRPVTGHFDIAHLRSIHHFLFQDVFPWAGEFRVVNIAKGDSMFGAAKHIEGALADALSQLAQERFVAGLDARAFADRAAFFLGEINAIHPFREGNGRTQREFIRQLAIEAGHPLSWAGFTQQRIVDASILSHTRGENSGLAAIVFEALRSTREAA